MITTESLGARKLRLSDFARLSAVGLRTRKLRAGLSALGIAIGVAAIVAVLGLSSSAQAGLLNEISPLGTNLLVVQNGQNLFGQTAELPGAAPSMIARIGPVTQVQETGSVSGNVYRSPLIPTIDTNALSIEAASLGLLLTVGTSVAEGSYLNAATAQEPVWLFSVRPPPSAWASTGSSPVSASGSTTCGATYPAFCIRAALVPAIDSSVLVGFPAAEHYLGFDGLPSTIYVRAVTSQVDAVDNVLAATANPENPSEVDVSQPSAALVAQADAQGAFDDLFLGLGRGGAARRGSRGGKHHGHLCPRTTLRRSVCEELSELPKVTSASSSSPKPSLLALIGGAVGVGAGAVSTAVYASSKSRG